MIDRVNPFDHNNPVTPPIFTARKAELEKMEYALRHSNESISISGSYGIGKSSLILTSLEKFGREQSTTFILRISDGLLFHFIYGDFLAVLTHKLCASVWTDVFKESYSELLEDSLRYPRNTDATSAAKKTLKRIFRVVTSENIASSGSKTSTVGAKMIASGSTTESNSLSLVRKPLMPFEFLALLDEILGVISEFGYTKIIVVCDQLNHLPPKANYDLLRQNIDVLASKKITFVVSAENIKNEKGFEDRVDTEILLKSFSLWMNLVGFGSRNEVKDYVDNCFAAHQIDDIDFIDGNCDLIYSVCEGNPWFIAKMLRMVYQDVIAAGKNKIDIGDFEKYGIRFAKAVTAYKAAEGCLRWSELNDMLNMG